MMALLHAREADAAELLSEESHSFLGPARAWQGFLLGWLNGTVFYLGTCYWVYSVMHPYGGLSPVVSVLLLILFSLYIGLHHGIFGALVAVAGRSKAGFSRKALVLAPFLWVAVELLRAYVVSFPWNLLGNAQIENLPLVRLASLTGVYGVSFEIAVVNTVFAAAFLVQKKRRKPLLIAALGGAVALQATVFVQVPPAEVDATATLVQQNVPIVRQWTYPMYKGLVDELTAISVAPAPPKEQGIAPLIVWPESPAPFETDDRLFNDVDFGAVARAKLVAAGRCDGGDSGDDAQRAGAGVQLGCVDISGGRDGGAVRQGPLGAVGRVRAVCLGLWICEGTDARGGSVYVIRR